ncbi:MAG: hypothetical protein ABR503_17510 [Chitinophagaceae bacterium]
MRRAFLIMIIGVALLNACNNYGNKVQINAKSEVYYKDNASEAEAKKELREQKIIYRKNDIVLADVFFYF